MYLFRQFVNVCWDTSNRFIGSVYLPITVTAWIFGFGVATPATHHVSHTFLTRTYERDVTGPIRTHVFSNLHLPFMLYNMLKLDSCLSKRHSEADMPIKFVMCVAHPSVCVLASRPFFPKQHFSWNIPSIYSFLFYRLWVLRSSYLRGTNKIRGRLLI